MALPSRVYDNDDDEQQQNEVPQSRPKLRLIQGGLAGGGSSNRKHGADKSPGSSKDDGKKSKKTKETADSESLSKSENLAALTGAGIIGGGLKNEVTNFQKMRNNLRMSKKQRNKALLGGGITGGIIGFIITVFLALIPLKIEHIVNNLENHFFAAAHLSLSTSTENLYKGYMKKVMAQWPGLPGCTGTSIDRHCSGNFVVGGNPITKLYKDWSQNRLEEKLATKYGIEYKYDAASHQYYMKAPGLGDKGIGVGTLADMNNPNKDLWSALDKRNDVRAVTKAAIQDETLFHRVVLRFKIGRLLEEKYGIRRCVIFCKPRDAFADAQTRIKRAAEIMIAKKVIQPRNAQMGVVIQCLLDPMCAPEHTATDKNPCTVGRDCESHKAPVSETDKKIVTTLEDLAAKAGIEDISKAVELYDAMEAAGGLPQWLTEMALKAILGEETGSIVADKVASAIPWIGWIDTAAQAIKAADEAGPKLKKLAYISNAAAAVALFMLYRSYSDEIKSSHANGAEVGSFVDSLGPGTHADPCAPGAANCKNDPVVGGTATAEATPLYNNLIGGNQAVTSTISGFIQNTVSPKAYAATPAATPASNPLDNLASTNYLCNNGSPVPAGQLICSEEVLGAGNAFFNLIHDALNGPLSFLKELATIWNNSAGKLLHYVSNLLGPITNLIVSGVTNILDAGCIQICLPFVGCHYAPIGTQLIVPGYCTTRDIASKYIPKILDFLTKLLLPNPFGTNMSGGRTFDLMAAGADVSGNDYSHNGLGGKKLTPQQSADILNQQQQEDKAVFQHKPLFARMFDTTDPLSLVSRVAMALPSSPMISAQNSFANFLSNPFGVVSQSFGSVLTASHANAATPNEGDVFGVAQYGYPVSGPEAVPADPQTYWDQNCADNPDVSLTSKTQAWNQAAADYKNSDGTVGDINNGTPVNTTTNPCLLIEASVGGAGGLFDSSLLTPDDLANVNNSTNFVKPTNSNVYLIGDSLSVGMDQAGLSAKFAANGWNVVKTQATVGINIDNSIPKLNADTAAVQSAGSIVVELGTNHCSLSGTPGSCPDAATFTAEITKMINAIKAINPTANIYWMNIYSGKPVYQSVNQAISAASSAQNFRVIDWASQAATGGYTFDPSLQVHPNDYGKMATWFSTQLGKATAMTVPQNFVAQTLQNENPPRPSLMATVLKRLGVVSQTLERPFKQIDILVTKRWALF